MRLSSALLLGAAAATAATTESCRANAFAPENPATWRSFRPLSSSSRHRRHNDGGIPPYLPIADLRGGSTATDHHHRPANAQRATPPGAGDSKLEGGAGGTIGRSASGVPLLEAAGKIVAKVRPTSTLRAVFGAVPSFWSWIRSSNNRGKNEEDGSGGSIGHRSFVDAMHSAKTYRLCVLYVLGYLSLSVGAYSYGFEKWPIIDSLYFAVTCFTSVGYGDICPQTVAAKIFTALFVLYGISILGIALGIVGSNLVEVEQNAVGRAGNRVKQRLLKQFQKDSADSDPAVEPQQEASSFVTSVTELILNQLPNLALIGGLALWIGHIEGWSMLTSIYYGIITTTTVGLGDFSPSKPLARLVAVFFIPISVAVLGELLGRVAGFFVDRDAERAELEFMNRDITEEDLALMDEDDNGDVDLAEFMSFMLVSIGKVDRETMDELRAAFESMDVAGDGVLNKKDLKVLALRKTKAAEGTPSS